MKVAFLLLDGEVTGGQVVARELMLGLRQVGHDAAAVSPREGPMLDRLRSDGFETVVVPQERAFRVDRAILLARAIARLGADVVDTHSLFVGNQLAVLAARHARRPLIRHVHIRERYRGAGRTTPLLRRLDRAAFAHCDAIVAVSEALRDELLEDGAPADRIVVVHNGVALPEPLAPAPDTLPLELVCAARLAPVKGQDVLIEALALAGEGIVVSFVGKDLEAEGAYREWLHAHARDLGVGDRVRFLGFRDDLPQLIERAHALVLPSRDEGLPLVALEAMARARPVVGSSVGGMPEVIAGEEGGLLVPPGRAKPLAAALERLRDDPSLRRRLGAGARSRVERLFDVELMRRRTIAVYERVLRRR